MNRRAFFASLVALPALAALATTPPRVLSMDGFDMSYGREWRMRGHIWHWDDVPVVGVMVDPYVPVGQVHCAGGYALVNARNAPPWPRDMHVVRNGANFMGWAV